MSRLSRVRQGSSEESNRGSPDPVLTLLDARQWSYLKKRYDLTPRELEIADLVCQGLENGSIAKHLKIQPGTVKAHVTSIFNKLGASSRAEAVAIALRGGLLSEKV